MFDAYTESVIILAIINSILALSLYLPSSAGQYSLAQGAFMGIGAYASAVFTAKFGLPFAAGLVLGGGIAAGVGILCAFPALKIKGMYLLLLTIGFNEIVRVFFLNFKYTGGTEGFIDIPLKTNIYNTLIAMLVLIFFFNRLGRSRIGRAMEAVRENEIAAETVGINLTYIKTLSYGMGAFIAGIAGGFYSHIALYIHSDNFGVIKSLEILIFLVVGGMNTYIGAIFGAIMLSLIPEWIRIFSAWRYVFYGGLIIIILIVRPQGIIDKDLIQKLKHNIRYLFA
jgi:branched-chain amino acid transport system permease protein